MANEQNLAPPWQPGQSGNPGGKTSAQRKLEVENAERATRIRAALLAKIEAAIDPETGAFTDDLSGDILKLIKDSEDRGLGAPKQTVDSTHDVGEATREAMREFNSRVARIAARSRAGGASS